MKSHGVYRTKQATGLYLFLIVMALVAVQTVQGYSIPADPGIMFSKAASESVAQIVTSAPREPVAAAETTAAAVASVPLGLRFPVALAIDAAANLYVADAATNAIGRISLPGALGLLAGHPGEAGSRDGSGGTARLNSPGGLAAAADGVVYIADTANGVIRRISSDGMVVTLAGSATARGNTDGRGLEATFSSPTGIALDAAGALSVADTLNNTIRRISPAGQVSTLAGSPGIAGDADGTGATARFNHPTGIAVDRAGNVYVADSINNLLRKISPEGVVTTLAGVSGVSGFTDGMGELALFANPTGLAIDGAGYLYVADTGNSTIRRVTPAGEVTTLAGLPGIAGLKDGPGASAWFNQPRAVALDANGNIFVADSGNGAIRRVTPTGEVSTLVVGGNAH